MLIIKARCAAVIRRPNIVTQSVSIWSQALKGRVFALPTRCYHSDIWNKQITIMNALIGKRKNTVTGKID